MAKGAAISIAGRWQFQLDCADAGVSVRWFDLRLSAKIKLPDTLAEQGIGDDITINTAWTGGIVDKSWFTAPEMAKYREAGNVKVSFWLRPENITPAQRFFQGDLDVPADWQGRRVEIFLERAHRETRVWVDGQLIGTDRLLSTTNLAQKIVKLSKAKLGRHSVAVGIPYRFYVGTQNGNRAFIEQNRVVDSLGEDLGLHAA